MSVEKEIRKAQELVSAKKIVSLDVNSTYKIYKGTNENINSGLYIQSLLNKEKILSVIGSGDQILNSIFLGCKKIDAFDISIFPKHYLKFKMNAVKELNYREFLEFFHGDNAFNQVLFDRVVSSLDDEEKTFWTSLNQIMSSEQLYNSKLFVEYDQSIQDSIFRNPYLKSPNSYYYLREKLKSNRFSITCYDGDIFDLIDKLPGDYDLINLSNICMYADGHFLTREIDYIYPYQKYKEFVTNLRVNPDGKILNYIINLDVNVSRVYSEYLFNAAEFHNEEIEGGLNHRKDMVSVYYKKH